MKISVYPHKGFKVVAKGATSLFVVTREGQPFKHCTRVDTATGVAWQSRTDSEGNFVLNAARDEVVEDRVIGSFRVVPLSECGAMYLRSLGLTR